MPTLVGARYANPTDRYPHNIMGRLAAHTDMIVVFRPCQDCGQGEDTVTVRLPEHLVFEDFAPRLVDLDADGRDEIVVVESHRDKGARLAIWDFGYKDGAVQLARGATTAFIGRRFRWLAPVGAADFDKGGLLELAYVETPHLGKTLVIVKRDGASLREIARIQGVTNHAIGQESVQSRIEMCADIPVIFVLEANGDRNVSVRLRDGQASLAIHDADLFQDHLDRGALCDL